MIKAADFDDELVSSVSHELRTPLAMIVGYAELLHHRDDEAIRREAPARILEAAERLSSAVDDLVTAFAIDSGNLVLDRARVELEPIIVEAIRLVEAKSDKQPLAARYLNGGAETAVWADPDRLKQILARLVRDVRERAPEGSEVVISAEREGGFAVVTLAHEAPERSGVGAGGFGLYLARRLVELHGGSLLVESEPCRGPAFSFTIPLADKEDLE